MALTISKNRFNAFVLFSKDPRVPEFFEELEYYSNTDSSILGVISKDWYDNDFNCSILCRDENNKFRAIKVEIGFIELSKAKEWIIAKIDDYTNSKITRVKQGNITQCVDLFTIVISEEKIHPYFKRLNEDISYFPAKRILLEISNSFSDIDGNFVEQFQSLNGFDSRLWELYLFCFLTEEKFIVKREFEQPDYIVEKGNTSIAIEAVIVDRKADNPPKYITDLFEKLPEEIAKENLNDMPLRFGSPLFSKLQKKYWEKEHIKGKPLILAIADFHDDMSMTWSFNSIIDYLFGLRFSATYDKDNLLLIKSDKIDAYTKSSGALVEAGYFFQPDVENISGVLFSSTATLSKFNRMGIQSGFGEAALKIFRMGANYKHDPNSADPSIFFYEVNETCDETWSEGLNLFHNPNALIPVERHLFPTIAHHQLINGNIHSNMPDFHPYFSINHNIVFV